jgi:hypothetical protein
MKANSESKRSRASGYLVHGIITTTPPRLKLGGKVVDRRLWGIRLLYSRNTITPGLEYFYDWIERALSFGKIFY